MPASGLRAIAIACCLSIGCAAKSASRVPTVAAGSTAPMAVVLTTDCGVEIDDQWALAHILLSPELQLRGVVATHASTVRLGPATSAAEAARVVARVATPKGAAIPIVRGADVPLQDASTPRTNAGVKLLVSASRSFSRERPLVILSTGAATDIASAILEDPSFADRVAIVAMGFQDWPSGGNEFNIANDPLAWQVILRSRVRLVVGSGSVGRQALRLTASEAAAVMRPHGETGEYLYQLFDSWLTRNAELAARMVAPGAWAIWDEIVVAYVLRLAQGEQMVRPQLQPDFFFVHPRTRERITWIRQLDAEGLWRDFGRKIDAQRRD